MIRLTREQVHHVDRLAIAEYHIPGIVLMENAARAVAHVAQQMLRKSDGQKVLVLCGGGNNGGDGLAAARHLHNLAFSVRIGLYADPATYNGDALLNWRIVQAMKLDCFNATPHAIALANADLIVDAIFGTGLIEPPRPPFALIVAAIEKTARPVLAVDLPSGLDCDTGQPLGPCIRARQTVTFVAEKLGFAAQTAKLFTGTITVAEIGSPRELLESIIR